MSEHIRSNEFIENAMRRWGDTVLRLALSHTRSVSDAEDVFQDVFLRLLKNDTVFNDDEHLKAWLLRVTINRCLDLGRTGWKQRNVPLEERHTLIAEPVDLMKTDVWEAVGELPFDLRTVVHLFYVEGFSTDEIARITNANPGTVRTRLHRARACLRETLDHLESSISTAQPSPFGKEAHYEHRSSNSLRFEDEGGESVQPIA